MTAPPTPPSWIANALRDLASIAITGVVGGVGLVAAALLVLAAARVVLLVGFWVALPIVTPGEVARLALPAGGAAWVRLGRGEPALGTLYVERPGADTARYALGTLAGPARPALALEAGRLVVRHAGQVLATLEPASGVFVTPSRRQARPDGLQDAWGRPFAPPGREGGYLAYWRAPEADAARAVAEGLGALGAGRLEVESREPAWADLAAGEDLVVIALDAYPDRLPGAQELAPREARGPYRPPAVWRVPVPALAAHARAIEVVAAGVRVERVAPAPRPERAVDLPTFRMP